LFVFFLDEKKSAVFVERREETEDVLFWCLVVVVGR
jgi:hypothetical protein